MTLTPAHSLLAHPSAHRLAKRLPAARLAVLTGARPVGQDGHKEVFALLRGTVLDVLVDVHHAAGLARAAGAPSFGARMRLGDGWPGVS